MGSVVEKHGCKGSRCVGREVDGTRCLRGNPKEELSITSAVKDS